jgi:MEDS: MEthanogen/methylotroph, DcmR Sensory domain
MRIQNKAVHLAGSTLDHRCHACAFFHNRDEEYRLLLPFIEEGFEHGDRLFQIVDGDHRAERMARIAALGFDVAAAERSGQLEVRRWEEAHLREQRFDQDAMLDLAEEVLGKGSSGFGLTRFWANMEWALTDFPGVSDIVEYESRLNAVVAKFNDIVVCTYDRKKFSAAAVMDVLRTHPQAILGGILQENPFYVEPEAFLGELRAREIAAE